MSDLGNAGPGWRPRVSVIVPTFNDVEQLAGCCRALASQDYLGELTFLVVNNSPGRDVASVLPAGDERFSLVTETRRGSYAARNAGIASADADVLAFTDADCLPRPDWLRRAVGRLSMGDAPDAVGGSINLVFRRGSAPVSAPEIYESMHSLRQEHYVRDLGFAATANLVVRVEAIRSVGAFDAGLRSGGDVEFGRRLLSSGRSLVFAPDAVVDHPSRPTWRALSVKSLRVASGLADLMADRPISETLSVVGHELRSGVSIWLRVWRMASVPGVRMRVKYAGAYSYVSLLRAYARFRGLCARLRDSAQGRD